MSTAAPWHREPTPEESYTWTGHTVRVRLARRSARVPTWLVTCREVLFNDTPLERSAEWCAVDAQYAALKAVDERLAEMSGEVRKAMGEA